MPSSSSATHVVGQHAEHGGRGEGRVQEVHRPQVRPRARPASGRAARSGSPAPARCRPRPPAPTRRRPWPGCRPGSPPTPPASGGRSGAGAAGRRGGGGSTRASCWRRRRRPAGRSRRRRRPGTRSRPSSCMRPWATASRSAAPIVTEAHVVPLPARSRCSDEASPPAAGTGTSAPSGPGAEGERAAVGDDDGAAHARARQRGERGSGRPVERGAQHVDGLGPQLVQRPVAVDALAEVDLGQTVRPELPGPRRSAGRARRRSRRRSRASRRPSGAPPSRRPAAGAPRTARGRAARARGGPPAR